jgi:hypothetical protein
VFVPMWPGDSHEAAFGRASTTDDTRLTHWWDKGRASDGPFAATLGLHGPAWDIYLLYAPGVIWSESTPPRPLLWMHQLSTERTQYPELRLDSHSLRTALETILGAVGDTEARSEEEADADR